MRVRPKIEYITKKPRGNSFEPGLFEKSVNGMRQSDSVLPPRDTSPDGAAFDSASIKKAAANSISEKLRQSCALFLVTTHYLE